MLHSNTTKGNTSLVGWVNSSTDRGTIDLLWSCGFAVVLCIWVATHANVGSPNDKWYHRIIDKFHLSMICLLGPECIFAIAVGQLSSARRCVKLFERDKELCQGTKWTYRHAFFVNMGGIFLTSPDFPDGFPINGEELHYLIKHGHVEFPDMESMSIDERNRTDTLSRLLTIWQVSWFSIVEFQRVHIGLPMTTLELTALSFVFVMVGTSICWFRKPSINRPRSIPTKSEKRVNDIRAEAQQTAIIWNWNRWKETQLGTRPQGVHPEVQVVTGTRRQSGVRRHLYKAKLWISSWRNVTVNQNPEFTVRLRIMGPASLLCGLYMVARAYFYVEDLVSLRTQPTGVYQTVNRFVPFLGS
ncbi:hypothetical protein O1611_g4828 [Lasiodiplodia mahajangana]|uniref:Uncharacterized protein n=1 Tax=Lasiodiplodia mahajangana TaxID=1108764 RepID=A0ACC2JN26_9PEZI|nr:hypothetical protein O1611_g4828 [Lasiodiplodia mahajangana]